MSRESIFRELVRQSNIRDEYLNTVPNELHGAVFDNGYVNSLGQERDILLKTVFGEHTESVEWFLYEWRPGARVGVNGIMTNIYSLDAYIQWMKDNEGFE